MEVAFEPLLAGLKAFLCPLPRPGLPINRLLQPCSSAAAKGMTMRTVCRMAACGLGVGLVTVMSAPGNYAGRVVHHEPSTATSTSLTNPVVVLGEPSRVTDDPDPVWGGLWPVNPFGGPYLADQILQLDTGASLTVEMQRPVLNDPENPYGMDFLVFGNAFFQLNSDWTTTSGFLGGANEGSTRISVSADGQTFYALNPALASVVDTWFPTDGQGDFGMPVNPVLGAEDFAGRNLTGVRQLYDGSGGGTGYDVSWAVDEQGTSVHLPWVRFVRFEQADDQAQLDAVSGVVPRRTLFEDFSAQPADHGWQIHGDDALFNWDPVAEHLEVTWDSSRPNSYFHHPLGTVLSRADDFLLSFDLRLNSIAPGTTEGKPAAFQIALGLVEFESATRPGLFRGTGMDAEAGPRNVLEFDYFPDGGFGATLSPVVVSGNNQFVAEFAYPVELPIDQWVRIVLDYSAENGTLQSQVLSEDQIFHRIDPVTLTPEFNDFRFDSVAICSFSDEGQSPDFPQGSVRAQGVVDNLLVVLPDLPVDSLQGGWNEGSWTVEVRTQPGWEYHLERTLDLQAWTVVDTRTAVGVGRETFVDPAPLTGRGFYRVRAIKP